MIKTYLMALINKVLDERSSTRPSVVSSNGLESYPSEVAYTVAVLGNAYIVTEIYNFHERNQAFAYFTPEEVAQHIEGKLMARKLGV